MFDHVASIDVGAMDVFDAAMDFDDLTFLSLILSLQESDQALTAKMQDIRALNEQKRSLTDELAGLNKALQAAGDGDELIEVGLELGVAMAAGDPDPDLADVSTNDLKNAMLFFQGKLPAQAVAASAGDFLHKGPEAIAAELNRRGFATREQVDARIEDIRNQLEELNTASSIQLIDLNRLLNKRNEAIQLTSNVVSQSHQTAMSIISNFRS
jgi:hypothetical protein